jgi:DNA invertase Pin-like site-specific DNA recombinase
MVTNIISLLNNFIERIDKMKTKKMEHTKRNIAYLRVSTQDQDTEKNKADILSFANDRSFGTVEFVEETISGKVSWKNRKISQIIDDLKSGDRLIVPELSRLGRSLLDIMEMLSIAKRKGISIYDIKNKTELNGSFQAEIMATIFGIASQIERDLISARTIEGLKAARAKGKLLGRPKGPGKSKLDQYRPEIEALLQNGSTKTFIATRYRAALPTLHNWLHKNKIVSKPLIEGRT